MTDEFLREAVHWATLGLEIIGVLVILIGALIAVGRLLLHPKRGEEDWFARLRSDLGRSILLGLEFLVAADIISTVAIEPTLERVLVLGAIVLIRTFLSFSLEVEIEGRWPWQQAATRPAPVPVPPPPPPQEPASR